MMVSRSAHFYMAVALLAAAVPVTGLAADRPGYEWVEEEGTGAAFIYYGSRDADPFDEAPFLLSCNNESKHVTFIFRQAEGAKVGKPPTVELSAGTAKASLTGVMSTPDENGHTSFQTIVDGVKPVVAVVQAPGALTVKMGETTMTLPEKGRAEAADKFVKGCKVE